MSNVQEIMSLFVDDTTERKKKIRDFVMDKNQSIDDRLRVWKQCPDHLAHRENWIIHLNEFEKKYGEICWYDDLYVEKYSTFDLREVDEYVEWNDEQIKDFYNECMDKGYFTFRMDW